MPGTGGLSQAEIEARGRELRSRDLITKTFSWYHWPLSFPYPPLPSPLGVFVPDQDYFMYSLDIDAYCFSYAFGCGSVVLSYAATPEALAQAASSGVNLITIRVAGDTKKFWNFNPDGFYIEAGRTLFIHGTSPATQPVAVGTLNMYLLPTGAG